VDRILFFDIETAPNKELIAACPPTFRAPAALTDSVEVMRWIAEKELRFPKSGAALDLDYAKITAIGLALGEEDPQAALVNAGGWKEKDILSWFWSLVSQAKTICGYNIVGFDLPIIQRRSFVLGVTPTRRLFDLKPWDAFTLDLMRSFYHQGYGPGVKYRGLKQVCKLFGIENPLPDLDGLQAAGMDLDTLRRYVVNDVEMTRKLWRRGLGHYW
jgi:predicted PolB exonuclease-like 3'-5' exonuclease